jgi:hypothetical protein
MLTEDFSRYFRDTYTIGIRYTTKAYNDIIKWDGWNPFIEGVFKKIITLIKNGKGRQDTNPKIEKGEFLSELISGKNYMTIFFRPVDGFTDAVYSIYDFKIGKCPNL